jgi:hypothetical protein
VTTAETALARVLPATRHRRHAFSWWWGPASLLLAVFTWPVSTLSAAGQDGYWPVGLHMAAAQGLHAGRDVVFTYGPLGFLAFPLLVTPATAVASFVFVAVAHIGLVAVVLLAVRRRLPWPAALVVAGAAGLAPVPPADLPVLLMLAGCVHVLGNDEQRGGPLVVALAGAVSGFELLVKLNDGLVCLLLAALAVWRLRPHHLRAELLLGASFAVSLAAFWRLTGAALGDLPRSLRLSAHLLVSYSQGMGLVGAGETLGTGVAVLCMLVALALAASRGLGRERGSAFVLAFAVLGFAFFKEGFVRADRAHTEVFFGLIAVSALLLGRSTLFIRTTALLLAAAALEQCGPQRHFAAGLLAVVALWTVVRALWPARPLHGWLAAAAGLLVLVLVMPPFELPRPSARSPFAQLRDVASTGRRAAQIAAARAAVRAQTPVPAAVLHALRGHTVDVEPFGATLAWAYGLDWHPEPLLESYVAYDSTLDRFAAHALAVAGPDRILLRPDVSIDGQEPRWEAPALVLAEMCNYRSVAEGGGFTVLARTPDRCAAPRHVSSTAAADGRWVHVPDAPPGELVYASIHADARILDRLRSLVLRPRELRIDTASHSFALVPGTASDPLVMTGVRRFRLHGAAARIDFFAIHEG